MAGRGNAVPRRRRPAALPNQIQQTPGAPSYPKLGVMGELTATRRLINLLTHHELVVVGAPTSKDVDSRNTLGSVDTQDPRPRRPRPPKGWGPWQPLFRFRRAFRNYPGTILHILLRRFPITVETRDGRKIIVHDAAEASAVSIFEDEGWCFDSESDSVTIPRPQTGQKVTVSGVRHNWGLAGVLSGDEYSSLDVNGKLVIDIGCSIGDSAIYFALRGASKVIGLEPYPIPYSIAVDNVARNNLGGCVTLIRAACGGTEGTISIDGDLMNTRCQTAEAGGGNVPTPVRTLRALVEEFEVFSGVLKVDCEGGEYEIFRSTDDSTLRRFDQVMVEYHKGPRDLKTQLAKAGFQVRDSGYRWGGKMGTGLITAQRFQPRT